MSTLSGKPRGPIDLSTYMPPRERQESESESQSPRSPYAPKIAFDLDDGERKDHGSTSGGPAMSEPRIALRSEPAVEDTTRENADAPTRESTAPHATTDRHADDAGGDANTIPKSGEQDDLIDTSRLVGRIATTPPLGLDTFAPLQPSLPRNESLDHSADKHGSERRSDHDLDRLESSLRWLQRQEAAVRLPRGPDLAPSVSDMSTLDARGRRYSDETVAKGARSVGSLEPERLAPPPAGARGNWLYGALVASAVIVAVGTLAYYLVNGGGSPRPPTPRLASVNPVYTPPASRQEEPARAQAQDAVAPDAATSTESKVASRFIERLQERGLPASESTAVPIAQEPAPQAPPARKPNRVIEPEEIKLLVQQGERFIATGDLITARTVFQRAAEAGDAAAAVALGATYDPVVLARLGVVGLAAADVEKARTWYQAAEQLGSPEATRRLQILAKR